MFLLTSTSLSAVNTPTIFIFVLFQSFQTLARCEGACIGAELWSDEEGDGHIPKSRQMAQDQNPPRDVTNTNICSRLALKHSEAQMQTKATFPLCLTQSCLSTTVSWILCWSPQHSFICLSQIHYFPYICIVLGCLANLQNFWILILTA